MKTHTLSGTRTYVVWKGLAQRCYNPKNKSYCNYGGRGITVCPEWRDFTSFLRDMGEAPLGLSLERRDNDLGYSKDNCEWATKSVQALNTRKYRNNTSGRTGVTFMKHLGKWAVSLRVNKTRVYGGVHGDFDEAVKRVAELELLHQGRVRPESAVQNQGESNG